MAIDPPVTKHQIEHAAQMQREASTTAEERRVWTEDQMHRCASPPTDLLPPLLLPITNELGMPTPQPPLGGQTASEGVVKQKHSHYYKDVSTLSFIRRVSCAPLVQCH